LQLKRSKIAGKRGATSEFWGHSTISIWLSAKITVRTATKSTGFWRHYGFTDEELDLIINYDIKYRMGRDAEADDE